MTTPVLICDDSSFARKQMSRSIPDGWDVDVSFAGNGEEALRLIREGKGDIMFLDLNMPFNVSQLDFSERRDHEHMNEKETQLSPRNRVAMTVI